MRQGSSLLPLGDDGLLDFSSRPCIHLPPVRCPWSGHSHSQKLFQTQQHLHTALPDTAASVMRRCSSSSVGRLCQRNSQQILGALQRCVLEQVSLCFPRELCEDLLHPRPVTAIQRALLEAPCAVSLPAFAGARSCPRCGCPCPAPSRRPWQTEGQLPRHCPAEPRGAGARAGDQGVFSSHDQRHCVYPLPHEAAEIKQVWGVFPQREQSRAFPEQGVWFNPSHQLGPHSLPTPVGWGREL